MSRQSSLIIITISFFIYSMLFIYIKRDWFMERKNVYRWYFYMMMSLPMYTPVTDSNPYHVLDQIWDMVIVKMTKQYFTSLQDSDILFECTWWDLINYLDRKIAYNESLVS